MTRVETFAAAVVEQAKQSQWTFPVSRDFWDAYWQAFAELGPRHRNVARWIHDLGWLIDMSDVRSYLAPEVR